MLVLAVITVSAAPITRQQALMRAQQSLAKQGVDINLEKAVMATNK